MLANTGNISKVTLQRLPIYLSYLKSLPAEESRTISATAIAAALGLGEVQVRKDLACVSGAGKPRVGYWVRDLVEDLEHFLSCDMRDRAVLVGVGNLGLALMSYGGFADYGLNIAAAFDKKDALVGTHVDGIPVLPSEKITEYCRDEKIAIGILTVPIGTAQNCADALVRGGVRAIWNFSTLHLAAPADVLVQNENMASSLALLSYHLKQTETGEA